MTIATLNSSNLPKQFSYKLPVSPRRQNLLQTYNYVVLQYSPYMVESDGMISWEIPNACASEYAAMYALFNVGSNPTYTFTGYWGDSYQVKFYSLDEPEVRSRMFSISGSFLVVHINSYVT